MRVPMKKIIREAMAKEMESSGFRLIRESGDTWVKLLDQNKVVQIYQIRFTPLKGETNVDFQLSPIIFPHWCGWRDCMGVRYLWDIDWSCFLLEGERCPDTYLSGTTGLFFQMHGAQTSHDYECFKQEYIDLLIDKYIKKAMPHFLKAHDIESCISEYEKIMQDINSPLYSTSIYKFNMYYIRNYLYKCIYNGELESYIAYVEEHNRLCFNACGEEWTRDDSKENLTHYKARDTEYFMNKYKKAQKENAEEAAKLLGMDKEAFPYVPPLKELKL